MNLASGLRGLAVGVMAVVVASCDTRQASAPRPAAEVRTSEARVGTPFLVKDVLPGDATSDLLEQPTFFIRLGDITLLGASDKVHGRELWRTDGTPEGTSLVLDVLPGPEGSDLKHAVVLKGRVYFLALTNYVGQQYGLWSTDGTARGTVLVKNLRGLGTFLGVRDDSLLAITSPSDIPSSGYSLWKSDGTTEGTVLVKTSQSETGGFGTWNKAWAGSTLVFQATDEEGGDMLWKTDGTAEGTGKVLDPRPGGGRFVPYELKACRGSVFFYRNSPFGRQELWRTDGTVDGTVLVATLDAKDPSSQDFTSPPPFACVGDTLYFTAWEATTGVELWKSDGTTDGTVRVSDIQPGAGGSRPSRLTAHDGLLYFMAHDTVAGGEPWKSDGTAQGTVRVADLAPGGESSMEADFGQPMFSSPAGLFFGANDGSHGQQLWKTDGTALGTVRLTEVTPRPHGLGELVASWTQDTLYFWTRDDELWTSTGTVEGTGKVKTLSAPVANGLPAYEPSAVEVGGVLYFVAENEFMSRHLWRSDGTPAGTGPLAISPPLSPFYFPLQLTRLNDQLLFFAGDDEGLQALWILPAEDSHPPRRLASLSMRMFGAPGRHLVPAGTRAFITEWSYEKDALWVTDGTPTGTVRIKQFEPNSFIPPHPRMLTAVGDKVFFALTADFNHEELWTSDGTEAGTRRVASLADASELASFHQMRVANGRLFFWVNFASRGLELWTSDGTQAGTRALGFVSRRYGYWPRESTTATLGDSVFYVVSHAESPPELWKSNGAAPVKVKTFGTRATVNPPEQLTPHGDLLLFWADDESGGYEPWRSDGTEAGTVRVKDIRPGEPGAVSTPGPFVRLGGEDALVFAASDGVTGLEPWRTDGTEAGTLLLADLGPGVVSSAPGPFTNVGPYLYFAAWHPAWGRELWGLRTTPTDSQPPRLACPGAQVTEAVSALGTAVPFPPASVSDEDPDPRVSYSLASGSVFPLGRTEVLVTATDNLGNTSTCTFAVTVQDTQAPSVTCPSTVSAIATSQAGVAVQWQDITAQDTASTPTVSTVPARGSVFPVGTTDVVVTAADPSGNTTNCTFQVHVQVTAPEPTDAGSPDAGPVGPDGGAPDSGVPQPDGGTSQPDAGPPGMPTPEDSSGCGCQQSGGAGTGTLGLALLALLSMRRRRNPGIEAPDA